MIETVHLTGIREFTSGLRRLDKNLPKAVRVAGNEAADIVVSQARPRVPTGPGVGGHAKSSIRVASSQREVRVRAGSKKFPYYPWLDFGGRVGKDRSVHRPFLKKGRYIWKAYADHRTQVVETYQDGLKKIAREAGLDVKERG